MYDLSEKQCGRDIGKFKNLALALLVWMYVKQQRSRQQACCSITWVADDFESDPWETSASGFKDRMEILPSPLSTVHPGWLYSALYPTGTSYYILLLLRTSNVKQNEDWQHKFTRRIVRHCWREEKVTHYHILYVPFFWNYTHIPNFYMYSLAQGKSKYQLIKRKQKIKFP